MKPVVFNQFAICLWALFGLLCMWQPISLSDAPHKDEFARFIGQTLRSDRFRFQYEVNLFENTALKSIFVDEMFSKRPKSGCLIMDHGAARDRNVFSMYFWSLGEQYHESHWLRPFVCTSSRVGVDSGPVLDGLAFNLLPFNLANLFVYYNPKETDLALQGVGALLMNIFEKNPEGLYEQTRINSDQEQISWVVSRSGHQIEISIAKSAVSSFEPSDLASLMVSITRTDDDERVKLVAFLTILNFAQHFDEALVELPPGYSCSHSIPLNFALSNTKMTIPPRTKYTYEVSITKGTQIVTLASRVLSNHLSNEFPQPLDTLAKPETESQTFELLHDKIDDIIAVISSRSKSREVFRLAKNIEKVTPSLSVWDFNSRKRHVVNLETGRCDPPRTFQSSLFGGEKISKVPTDFKSLCLFEGVEVSLSKKLKLRLTEDGLKLLTFTFQDITNQMQLVHTQEDSSGTEFVYERAVPEKFCLIDTTYGPIQFKVTRLVSRYIREARENIMLPKSSSLLFFDTAQTQLMLQVDFNLLHSEPYEPWSSSRHLLDLSRCKSGYKESARVRIEYPLNAESQHLRGAFNPNKLIRSTLATNLRLSYGVSLLRVPAIEIDIQDDMMTVEVQLLERASLLSETQAMEVVRTMNAASYIEQLNKATRSVPVDSLAMCAEYCQLNKCEIFVYCNLLKDCHIYTDPAVLHGAEFGSHRSLALNCDAYQVPPDRIDSADQWRKKSWGLEEIVETLTDSIDGLSETSEENSSDWSEPIDAPKLIKPTGREACISVVVSMNPTAGLSRTLRLVPSYAEYHFDNLHSARLIEDKYLNPFNLMNPTQNEGQLLLSEHQPPHEMANNFKILKSGHKLLDSNPIQIHKAASSDGQATINSLVDSTGGHLTLLEQRLEDCLRLCLNELSCTALSHCTDAVSSCTLTSLNRDSLNVLMESGAQANSLETDLRVEKDPKCTIMQRTFSDQFHRMEARMLLAHSGRPLTETAGIIKSDNVDDCASECALNRATSIGGADNDPTSSSCLSFDFCRPIKIERNNNYSSVCILFKNHLVSNMPANSTASSEKNEASSPLADEMSLVKVLQSSKFSVTSFSYCTHYGRNYLADFHQVSRRRLPESMRTLTLRNYAPIESSAVGVDERVDFDSTAEEIDTNQADEDISLARCASLCEEDPSCGAFEFCMAKYDKAPHNLYLSCSLANESSFDLTPTGLKIAGRRSDRTQTTLLPKSQLCSVYIYRALSLILGHKKKNLDAFNRRMELELSQIHRSAIWNLFRLDFIVLVALFLFGFIVRDLDTNQFAFRRMRAPSLERTSIHEVSIDQPPFNDNDQISLREFQKSRSGRTMMENSGQSS